MRYLSNEDITVDAWAESSIEREALQARLEDLNARINAQYDELRATRSEIQRLQSSRDAALTVYIGRHLATVTTGDVAYTILVLPSLSKAHEFGTNMMRSMTLTLTGHDSGASFDVHEMPPAIARRFDTSHLVQLAWNRHYQLMAACASYVEEHPKVVRLIQERDAMVQRCDRLSKLIIALEAEFDAEHPV